MGRDAGDIEAAYRLETRRLIAARFPIAAGIFLLLMLGAYAIEWGYYPERLRPLSLCYAAFVAIAALGTGAVRRWPEHGLAVSLAASIGLAFTLVAYLALVHGSAELVLLAMIGFLTGQVVQFPWGARGQAVAAGGSLIAYLWALHLGAQPILPLPYALFALGSHAVMTVIGAQLLDAYRRTAFREAAEAARANAVKSEFLATVSHELRTPLNIIVGYTDLLLEGAFPSADDQADALGRIHQQSRQLHDLIQSMLDLNRMEAGGISLVLEDFPLDTALDGLRASLPAAWCKPGVALCWEVSDGGVLMRSDRGKLELILRNLVHNALKYTEHGTVTVQAQADARAGRVDFAVSDTGQGITPEDLAGIFDMFRQGSSGPPRGGGVGLGLYIVKQLTAALGGHIAVDSRPGAGARFTVSLPMAISG